MSARPLRPFRWIAGGSVALIVTIWAALMLGLNAPMIRSVPVAPWADSGYGADVHDPLAAPSPAARLSPGGAPPLRPARVAGVRVPAVTSDEPDTAGGPLIALKPDDRPEHGDGPTSPALVAVPALPVDPAVLAPATEIVPSLPAVVVLPSSGPLIGGVIGR